jgi:nucleotide-binding universal stress UspA family protein
VQCGKRAGARVDQDQQRGAAGAYARPMFKHILIATDGSPLAARGVRAGIGLAKAVRGRVTGLYVAFAYLPPFYLPGLSRGALKRISNQQAKKALSPLLAQARAAHVPCKTRTALAGEPWQAILRTARSARCDAIVMASHGRSGIGGLLLGSETTRVLAHAKVPVLVVR